MALRLKYSSRVNLTDKIYKFCLSALGVLWYTVFIFWGLKLNVDEIKFGNLFLVPYILIQYLTGLLFVAYIISFIIVRL